MTQGSNKKSEEENRETIRRGPRIGLKEVRKR